MTDIKSDSFNIKIGTHIVDNKRNLTIIDREYRRKTKKNGYVQKEKWYKYHCNKCGWKDGWIQEYNLSNNRGCSCCRGFTIIKGINDIATTNPELVKYFVDTEDTYKYTYGSGRKVLCKCPDCGFEKQVYIDKLSYYGFSCPKCSDGISLPEKVMFNFLHQLGVEFIKEYSSSNSKWCDKYKYDFYFKYNNEEYIIETHGGQHYESNTNFKMSLKEVKLNDKNKYELAIQNGIKPENYIVINCRYSKLDFIKNNIINSKLNKLFDLSNIDWIKIGQESEKSLVKEVCDYWNNKQDEENVNSLSKYFKISCFAIRSYLHKGTKIGWCFYDAKEEGKKGKAKSGNLKSKQVKIFKEGQLLGIFKSCLELERQSENLFGVKLYQGDISKVLRGLRKSHKGYTFAVN